MPRRLGFLLLAALVLGAASLMPTHRVFSQSPNGPRLTHPRRGLMLPASQGPQLQHPFSGGLIDIANDNTGANQQSESYLSVDPANPNVLLAAYHDLRTVSF